MAVAIVLLSLCFFILFPPFLVILGGVIFSASIGKSLGIRELYVRFLLYVFEFGKTRLAARRRYSNVPSTDSDSESSGDELQHRPSLIDEEDEDDNESNREAGGNEVIAREVVLRPQLSQVDLPRSGTEDFKLWDPLYYVRTGVEAIVEDEVTKRFTAEELTSWNFLTRTNCQYQYISLRLTIFWVVGFLVRYLLLLPLRMLILFIGTTYMLFGTVAIGQIPEGRLKRWLANYVFLSMFRIMARGFSNVVYYHNLHNRPRSDGICVANHTSPIDCIVLAQDGCYSFVGQRHGGFLGLLQRALSRASSHIWFERSEAKDRFAVARRLREHVEDPNKLPILIFPEGTCINNTSVMQFKKGTFEVGGIIYPVAIKYDPRFGDAFWNSSQFSMMSYILMMMTSWAIVCDVWYLPPMTRLEGETSIDFANRVKAEIARQGGLVDLIWDGGLKRSAPKKEWREQYQHEFSRRLRLYSLGSTANRAKAFAASREKEAANATKDSMEKETATVKKDAKEKEAVTVEKDAKEKEIATAREDGKKEEAANAKKEEVSNDKKDMNENEAVSAKKDERELADTAEGQATQNITNDGSFKAAVAAAGEALNISNDSPVLSYRKTKLAAVVSNHSEDAQSAANRINESLATSNHVGYKETGLTDASNSIEATVESFREKQE